MGGVAPVIQGILVGKVIQWLLVQGADGSYYSYHPRRQRLVRITLDEQWVLYAAVDGSMAPVHTDHDGQRDHERRTPE